MAVLSEQQFAASGHEHGGFRTRLPQEAEDRCTQCGHRLTDLETGVPPVETRYLGPRRWANEIPRRQMAMRRGNAPDA